MPQWLLTIYFLSLALSLKTTAFTHSPSRFRSWTWLNEPEKIQWVQAVGVNMEMEATFESSQLGIQTSPSERWGKTQPIALLVTVSHCAPSGWTHQTMIKTTSCTAHSCWGCQEWEDIYSSRFMTELQNQVQHLQGGGHKLNAFFFATEYYKFRIRTEKLLHTFKCMNLFSWCTTLQQVLHVGSNLQSLLMSVQFHIQVFIGPIFWTVNAFWVQMV